ncbi:MAG: hypothetical protein IJO03_00940 [Clostridia bacterium]|nr:hypothetical protein [Clostridia bacterium]
MKLKKLLSILLSVLMLTGIFSVGASAADELGSNEILIAGTVIDGSKESWWLTVDGALTANGASASNYNIRITPATATSATKVTLKNAQINKFSVFDEDDYVGIGSSESIDVELQGTNKIDILPTNHSEVSGISASDIKVYGSGSLAMILGSEYSYLTFGILGKSIDISGNAAIKLNLKAYETIVGTMSILATSFSDNANIEIAETCLKPVSGSTDELQAGGCGTIMEGMKLSDNAKVNLTVTDPYSAADIVTGFEIAGNTELSGNSHININCCGATESSIGIYTKNGNLALSGKSTVTAKSGKAETSYGINLYAEEDGKSNAILSGESQITATSGDGSDSCGMMIKGNIVANDNASIQSASGKSENTAYGILSDNITLSDSAKIKAVSKDGGYMSVGIFSSVNASGTSSVRADSGKAAKEGSCGLMAIDLTMSDYAEIEANAKSGNSSYGIMVNSRATLSGKSVVDASADNATVTSCGFYANQLTMTDMVYSVNDADDLFCGYLSGWGRDAASSFGVVCEKAALSGVADIMGRAGFGTEKSCGFYTISEGTVFGENCYITGGSDGSEKYSAGIHFEGDITVSGESYIFGVACDAPESYGIISKTLTVSSDATIDARGETQAVFGAVPNLDGYEDVLVQVSTTTEYSETEWDGTTALGGEDSPYKHILIDKAPFKLELNFFQKILIQITLFFASIAEFFESLFSF